MAQRFEWDASKAGRNFAKHGISFEEAATAFADTLSITIPDPLHSEGENRYVLIGLSSRGHLLVVVHTDRDNVTRLISARMANRLERKTYEQS